MTYILRMCVCVCVCTYIILLPMYVPTHFVDDLIFFLKRLTMRRYLVWSVYAARKYTHDYDKSYTPKSTCYVVCNGKCNVNNNIIS